MVQSEAGIEMKISHKQMLIPSGAVIGDCASLNVPGRPPASPQHSLKSSLNRNRCADEWGIY